MLLRRQLHEDFQAILIDRTLSQALSDLACNPVNWQAATGLALPLLPRLLLNCKQKAA